MIQLNKAGGHNWSGQLSISRWRRRFEEFANGPGKRYSGDPALLFSLFIKSQAQNIRKRGGAGGGVRGNADAARLARRTRMEITRKARSRPKRFVINDPEILGFRYKDDYLIDGLISNYRQIFVSIFKETTESKVYNN